MNQRTRKQLEEELEELQRLVSSMMVLLDYGEVSGRVSLGEVKRLRGEVHVLLSRGLEEEGTAL